jgi:predicted dehydrogenase
MWAGPSRPDGVFDVEDGVAGLLRLDGGVGVQIHTNWASNLPDGEIPDGVVVMGTRGVMRFDPWGTEVLLSGQAPDGSGDRRQDVQGGGDWAAAFRRQHEHFAAAVTGGTEPVATAAQGLEVQEVLDALYDSAGSGREVDLQAQR